MTAFEYGDSILIVDCGMSFPDEEMFGVDVVIPDFDYIEKNKKKVRGLVITHGHEDHIGGVPYLLKRVSVPVYGTGLSLGLIGSKLTEHGIKGDMRRINAGQKLTVGPFKIETVHATHSIADAICLAITTPIGVIFHTGDFKIDYTPVDGEHFDLQKLAEIGSRGVLLLMSDSTNAVRKGYTASEQHLNTIMENIFSDTKSRILIATFASNIHRIQTIINTAAKFDRKVALSGRSMLKILDLSMDMGYVKIKKNQLVDIKEIKNIPDNKLVIITTGSQGEPMSALARMASNDHREVSIKRGDKIVLSSSPIPGNEKSVSNIVNRLLEKEAEVIYSDIADIHVSGHACEEELKLMLSLIKPKYFMPVHGEVRHLRRHAEIAESLGWPSKHIFMLKNGDALDITGPDKLKVMRDQVEAEPVFVDGLGVGDISSLVLRDRKLLSESGLIIVMATIDSANGRILSGPDIVSRGFVYVKDNEDLMEDVRNVAYDKLYKLERDGVTDYNALKTAVKEELRRYIFRKTKRSPVILPILMEA
jgi:ribonuclease J